MWHRAKTSDQLAAPTRCESTLERLITQELYYIKLPLSCAGVSIEYESGRAVAYALRSTQALLSPLIRIASTLLESNDSKSYARSYVALSSLERPDLSTPLRRGVERKIASSRRLVGRVLRRQSS